MLPLYLVKQTLINTDTGISVTCLF